MMEMGVDIEVVATDRIDEVSRMMIKTPSDDHSNWWQQRSQWHWISERWKIEPGSELALARDLWARYWYVCYWWWQIRRIF